MPLNPAILEQELLDSDPNVVARHKYGIEGTIDPLDNGPETPSEYLEQTLNDPAVQDLLRAGEQARADYAAASAASAGAARSRALKRLDIQKARLMFQQRTGLRDIEQARAEGLQKAINNALQRGIYRSGIRIENEERVERESDEAASDLKEQVGFGLQDLALQRQGINASGSLAGKASRAANALTIEDLAQAAELQAASTVDKDKLLDVQGGNIDSHLGGPK